MSNTEKIIRAMDHRYMLASEIATRSGLTVHVVRRIMTDLDANPRIEVSTIPAPDRRKCYRLAAA